METPTNTNKFKRKVIHYLEISQKNIKNKVNLIMSELSSLIKENEVITSKCKMIIDKIENYDSLNGTFLSDISKKSKNSPSKINIENLVINKKVQIGKHFSHLKINSIRTITPNRVNRSAINTKSNDTKSIKEEKKTPTKYKIKSHNKTGSFAINSSHVPNKLPLRNNLQKQLKLKKNNTITESRKLSIIDIPSINSLISKNEITKSNNTSKHNSIFDYLGQKNQKLFLVLSQANVLPLRLRKIFLQPIQYIYSISDLRKDALNLYQKKEKELNVYKTEFINFNLSLTCQCMINFINEESINEYINAHSNLAQEKKDIATIFKILFIIFDEEYQRSELYTIVSDFFSIVRTKNSSFKQLCVNRLNEKLYLRKSQIEKINSLFANLPTELTFNDDKITTAMLFIVKEVHSYSNLKINNEINMFEYLHRLKELHHYKDEINNL